jgi:predicted ATP-binding protein involved in virulence
MRLKKMIVNNFRCFEHLEIDLHPRLTVLVAENGGGKTAILDCIAIGLSPVLRYLSSAIQRLSGPGIEDTDFRLMTVEGAKGRSREVTSDYAQVILETSDGLIWDNWRAAIKGKHPATKVGHSQLSAYSSELLGSLSTPAPKLLPVFAYYGARRGWIVIPKRLSGSKVDYSQPTAALYGALDDLTDFKELVNWFYQEDAAEARANKTSKPEDYEEFSSLTAVRHAISRLLGGTYLNPQFNRQHKFVIESTTGPAVLQISQLSQGYQSMLALGMDFARRLALANEHLTFDDLQPILMENKNWLHTDAFSDPDLFTSAQLFAPGIMLVDEIDLHLHPTWQQRVLGDLMRAFPFTQFIVTTHSPQVLTTVPSESIRILENGQIHAAPPGTEGAESSRLLTRVLGANVRPPEIEATKELNEYLSLVDSEQWDSPQAHELRTKLNARYQGEEPALLDADLIIENRKWELGQ